MPRLHYDALKRLAAKAYEGGAVRRGPAIWEWDVSGRCEAPVTVTFWSRPSVIGRRDIVCTPVHHVGPREVIVHAPCRTKCGRCLRRRAAHWRLRARHEIGIAPRSWFGTLTLAPEAYSRALAVARRNADRSAGQFDELSEDEQFKKLCAVLGEELTLFLKRVRKNSRAKIRYMIVAEKHKSGVPHFHFLMHESQDHLPVRHAVLKAAWHFGFGDFKLCGTERASYVAKYIAKSSLARVRASLDYGSVKTYVLHRAVGGEPSF